MRIPTNRVTLAGLLVAIGIIYGDIGTSPLYVFSAIIKEKNFRGFDSWRVILYYLDAYASDYHQVCDPDFEG